MSLLDDARWMRHNMPTQGGSGDRCYYCLGGPPGAHDSDCPWPSMPKIVAALEAADRLTRRAAPLHGDHVTCVFCWQRGRHADDCAWAALYGAMKA